MTHHCLGTTASSLLRLILHFIYMYLSFVFFFRWDSVGKAPLQARVLLQRSGWGQRKPASSLRSSNIRLYYFFLPFTSKILKMFVEAVKPWFAPWQYNLRNSIRLPRSHPEMGLHPLSKVWKSARILKVPELCWDSNTFLLPCQINLWKHRGGKALENPILFYFIYFMPQAWEM